MRWPWVSRLAYETVVSERDRLRAQNDELVDHFKRVDRVANGMTERKIEPRKAIVWPLGIREHLDKWPARTRMFQEQLIVKAHTENMAGGMDEAQSWQIIGQRLAEGPREVGVG